MISPIFFAWVMGLGSKVRIVSPASVRDSFIAELRATIDSYDGGGEDA
jgi:predicted DNA-binding transcriptional regulator YafY